MFEPSRPRVSPAPLIVAGLIIVVIAFVVFQLNRSLPAVIATTIVASESVLGEPPVLPMPAEGASNVAVSGLGLIATGGSQGSRPIASVTKMMTAYLILKNHPLQPGEEGPTIPITVEDEERFLTMLLQDQSVLPVSAGLNLSQLEMLQGLLVPSANNFGEILAKWDAGSTTEFVSRMNAEARALGMTNTVYADVSGFSAGTTSSPADQLILARVAMENPVFASIVAMQEMTLPGIGLVDSTNAALGLDGVVGIKTGYTEEAGGNLAFAARREALGQQVEILGMVFGQENRPAAFAATRAIVTAVAQGLQFVQVMNEGQVVAQLETEWGGVIDVIAAENVSMMLWPGMTLHASVVLDPIEAPSASGTRVGTLTLTLGEQEQQVPVVLGKKLDNAGLFWRLARF